MKQAQAESTVSLSVCSYLPSVLPGFRFLLRVLFQWLTEAGGKDFGEELPLQVFESSVVGMIFRNFAQELVYKTESSR